MTRYNVKYNYRIDHIDTIEIEADDEKTATEYVESSSDSDNIEIKVLEVEEVEVEEEDASDG